jgi:hypothetical protein
MLNTSNDKKNRSLGPLAWPAKGLIVASTHQIELNKSRISRPMSLIPSPRVRVAHSHRSPLSKPSPVRLQPSPRRVALFAGNRRPK